VGAAFLMFLLRCAMGFSVGGEHSGVLTMLVESADRRNRGFVVSLASAASEVGALLAAGVSALVVGMLATDDLDAWGWRIPFFFGGFLALLTLVMRTTVHETPAFERARAEGKLPKNPIADVIRHQWRAILRTFAISALGSATYYVAVTYVPTYLTSGGGVTDGEALTMSTIAAVAVTPAIGAWSDRTGRRKMLLARGRLRRAAAADVRADGQRRLGARHRGRGHPGGRSGRRQRRGGGRGAEPVRHGRADERPCARLHDGHRRVRGACPPSSPAC
jgi:MHS family proline/betaine transporter-like MFS transporter